MTASNTHTLFSGTGRLALAVMKFHLDSMRNERLHDMQWDAADDGVHRSVEQAHGVVEGLLGGELDAESLDKQWEALTALIADAPQAFSRPASIYGQMLQAAKEALANWQQVLETANAIGKGQHGD